MSKIVFMRILSRLRNAPTGSPADRPRRDVVLYFSVLVAGVILLAWNAGLFMRALDRGGEIFGLSTRVIGVALLLNIALLLVCWIRFVSLRQQTAKLLEAPRQGELAATLAVTTDPLTGLLNRKGFASRAAKLDSRASARGDRLSIFSIQLSRFKSVTDCHGAHMGDATLQQIAAKLSSVLRGQGAIGRLGSEEFVIAMIHPDGAHRRIEAAGHVILEAVTKPREIDSKLVQVGAFVGMAVRDDDGLTVADLLRRADIAVEHARKALTSRPTWFDRGMERTLIEESEIEQGIRLGIKRGQFIPYFEPQIDLATGAVVGFEALARWQHPQLGLIMPDTFISIAEQIGVIAALSEQVMQSAFAHAAKWDPSITLSVNISPVQLADSWFAQHMVRLLAETGFPASRLVVEITESSLFADIDQARTIVTSLKNQGIRLALDDFGTGFSSLSHLRSLPFDVIKIDRSFTSTIHRDQESSAIVGAIATLANALKVPVTVEGIEDAETEAAVRGMGCAVGQGWYYGKPMPAEKAADLLRNGPDDIAPEGLKEVG